MFGAFIGDVVGSKYEFNNIKTKIFPLFSQDCDYTDDTIMTVAVAKAIMMSRTEQFEKNDEGRGFQEFLVEIMQDFGRKTQSLTEATETDLQCGSHPADWRQLLWMKRWHWLVQVRA